MSTFTWTDGKGTEYEVEPAWDVDTWTGKELRTVERVCGGEMPDGRLGVRSMVFAVAIARTVPGYTIESADSEMTLGQVRRIVNQLRERDEAAATAATEEKDADEPIDGVVMSPTKPGEPGDADPLQQ